MDFITGGAFQGKLDFARKIFGIRDEEIYTCTDGCAPDWNCRCIQHLERYVYYCVRNDIVPELSFRSDAVLIGDDIFCGVVPIDPVERSWREETGRYFGRISNAAESVHRLFCGLPLRLK